MNKISKIGKKGLALYIVCLLLTSAMCQGVQAAGYSPASGAATGAIAFLEEAPSEESSGGFLGDLGKTVSELAGRAGKALEKGVSGLAESAKELIAGLFSEEEENAGDTKNSRKEEAASAADTLQGSVSDTVDTVKEKAGEAADTLQESVSDTVDIVKEKAGEAADTLQESVSNMVDTVQETVGGAADAVQETVGGAADAVQETVGGAADAVQETVGGAADAVQETVGGAADTVQETADALADAFGKAQEQYQVIADKLSRVLVYLKGKIAETNITDAEWAVLRSGYDRAVSNAFRAGWLGEKSREEIELSADSLFETIRYTYLLLKEKMTPAEYGEAILKLSIRNGNPQKIGGLIGNVIGLDPKTSELAGKGALWILRVLSEMDWASILQ